MDFAAPALLLGVAGALAPLLIHLLLRPRPTRVIFPAISFLQAKLAAGARAQRVRNVWLLIVRAAWIACLSLLLAGPRCRSAVGEGAAAGPTAAVIVVDDSWSTHYRVSAEQTTLNGLLRAGTRRAREVFAAGPPSVVGLVFADAARLPEALTAESGTILRRLSAAEGGAAHAQTLAGALQAGGRMLRNAAQSQRRLIILTDGAAHAWRALSGGQLADVPGLAVELIAPAPARSNLALVNSAGPDGVAPESMPCVLRAAVRCDGPAARVTITVTERARPLIELGPVEVAADSIGAFDLALPPLARGLHGLRLDLRPEDRLMPDQIAYVALEIGPRPGVWLIAPPADLKNDLSAIVFSNLLAPEGLRAAEQPVALEVLAPQQFAARAASPPGNEVASDAPRLIVLLGDALLADAARERLRRIVERGAVLLLAPCARDETGGWDDFRQLFSATPPRYRRLAGPLALRWEDSALATAAARLGGEHLATATARRRYEIPAMADGVTVHLRYGDGAPALLARPLGRGQVYWLTTAPDPAWSELGQRAGGMLALLHALVRDGGGEARTAQLSAGQAAREPLAGVGARGAAVVERLDGSEPPIPVMLENGRPREGWPAALPGLYGVRAAGAAEAQALYAVNWTAEESDPTPISDEQAARLLGVPRVTRIDAAAQEVGQATGGAARWSVSPQQVLATALILLLALESLMSLRRAAATRSAAPAPPAA